jgi:hypothetical protein
MVLRPLNPFTYSAFATRNQTLIPAIVDFFNRREPDFWANRLKRYSFREQDYRAGKEVRLQFNKAFSYCSSSRELHTVASEILEWGGMKPLNNSMKNDLQSSLSLLTSLAKGESDNINQLCVERLASITKIYEMWDLNNWVIYDSYCVRGLQWLISNCWQSMAHSQNEDLLRLPWPPGRVGSPVSGFPRAADGAPKQKRLGFIYGSWLCEGIAEYLNRVCGNDLRWRPYHIEMLAFQIGHEI